MWTIPTRGRPHNLRRLIEACRDTGMTTPALVMVDADDPMLDAYRAIDLPGDWTLSVAPRAHLATLYNSAFRQYPDRDWYGFLADDVVPLTKDWDRKLIEVAGLYGLAAPSGSHHATIAAHFVLGGDLVRAMGWLCLPGLSRIYIDTAWNDIAIAKGIFRHVPEVILEHRHFSNGKAMMDKTYRKTRKEQDKQIYQQWRSQ